MNRLTEICIKRSLYNKFSPVNCMLEPSFHKTAPDLSLASGTVVSNKKIPREAWWYLGPAFVASVAYMDPGNFATNIEGGARFGYQLLWVLLWSNGVAIL